MFWLSHHAEGELHRCYRFGPLQVCARCLGTYPALLLSLGGCFWARAPLESPFDVAAIAVVVPAVLDWAVGRFWPHVGTNLGRTATGVLLGLGLGRSLFVHVQKPFPVILMGQAAVVLGVGLPVVYMVYRRNRQQ